MLSLLFFRNDNVRYAVAVTHVDSIVWLPSLSVLDGMPFWFAGLLNLHGKPVPVLDFARLMGHALRPHAPDQKLMLLMVDDRRFALIVDHVEGIEELPDLAVAAFHPRLPGEASALPLAGEVHFGDDMVMLVDAPAVLALIPFSPGVPASAVLASPAGESVGAAAPLFHQRMHRLAEPAASVESVRALVFAILLLGVRRYAVNLEYVVEFSHLKHLTLMPGCPSFIMGCMNLRGEIVTIIDLSHLLNMGNGIEAKKAVVLFLNHKKIALNVQAVERLAYVAQESIVPIHETDEQHPLVRFLLREEDAVTAILDVEALLGDSIIDVNESYQ